jgi:hypothetical protein
MIAANRALVVQRMVILVLLLLFLAVLVAFVAASVADPSAVLIPAVLAGLVGTLGLAVLAGASGRGRATSTNASVAGKALQRATVARSILLVGGIAVAGLGAALGLALSDGSVVLVGVAAAVGPALAGILASTARGQFAARAGNTPSRP